MDYTNEFKRHFTWVSDQMGLRIGTSKPIYLLQYEATVDGRNPASVDIYRVLYIPGGCLGFLPSTVSDISTTYLKTHGSLSPQNHLTKPARSPCSKNAFKTNPFATSAIDLGSPCLKLVGG